MGSGICTLDGQYFTAWDNYGSFTANTSTIEIITTSNYSIPFSGGGASYYNLWYFRGASTVDNSIIGATTFNDIKDDGSALHKFIFPASTTINVTSFTVSGASCGSKISLESSSSGTTATISDGTVQMLPAICR